MRAALILVAIIASSALPQKDTKLLSKVFWDQDLVELFEAPFAQKDRDVFVAKLERQRIVSLEDGCGRLKNRLAKLEDGTKMCCRYRDGKADIRSDLYAYHLAGFLGIGNVPPSVLVAVDFSDRRWRSVASEAGAVGWVQGSYVELTLYADGLSEEFVPEVFRPEKALLWKGSTRNSSTGERLRLMQWTDMIIFDYLTGHTDRLFSTLLNLQWSPGMLGKPVHNLEATPRGQLVFLDNEAAFLLGYEVARSSESYGGMQARFLKQVCVFKRETIESIERLEASASPWTVLEQYVKSKDSGSYEALGPLSTGDQGEFALRIRNVIERVRWCSNHTVE